MESRWDFTRTGTASTACRYSMKQVRHIRSLFSVHLFNPFFIEGGRVRIGSPSRSSSQTLKATFTENRMSTPGDGGYINPLTHLNPPIYNILVRIEHNDPTTPSIWKVGPSPENAAKANVMVFKDSATQAFVSSNSILALSSSSDSSSDQVHDVVFTDPNTTGLLTKVWYMYGHYVLVSVPDAFFCAQKTNVPGVYNLRWTTKRTLPPGHIFIRLRSIKPASDFPGLGGLGRM